MALRNDQAKCFIWLGVMAFLTSCSYISLKSKESMDEEEKKPWSKDDRTIDGAFNKSKRRLTPHIGFNLPVDNGPDPVKIPNNEKVREIKTTIDKKRKTIKVLTEKEEEIAKSCMKQNQKND